jgi:hypothetical protein
VMWQCQTNHPLCQAKKNNGVSVGNLTGVIAKVVTWRRRLRRPISQGSVQIGLRKRRRHEFKGFNYYCDNFWNYTLA